MNALRPLLSLSLLLVASACAADAQPKLDDGGATFPTASVPPVESLRALASDAPPGATVAPPVVEADAPPPVRAKRPPQVDPADWAPLTVELNTGCVGHGDELVVSATSSPRAGIGFAVGYTEPPDGSDAPVPDYAYFDHEANPTGTIHWAFVIRPMIAEGPAIITVVANGADGRGAFTELRFQVDAGC